MIRMAKVEIDRFVLQGGLDQVSPPLAMVPGTCRKAQNFEIGVDGGYKTVTGYERFDGRPSPSDAQYTVLPCTITGTIAEGNTVTGSVTGATGVVILVSTDFVAITKKVGDFNSSENLLIGGNPQATMTSNPVGSGAATTKLHYQYLNMAADSYRSDIGQVPGNGDILGIVGYNGDVYAFRNNALDTACVMHKQSTGGWTAVSFGYEVSFSNANTSVEEGDTLTQGAVTATIQRVMVRSGTLLSGTNTGTLIISAPAGGSFAAGAATSTGGGSLTLSGAHSAVSLLPGGTFEFAEYNFGAGKRLYGVDGVNRAWEFDGTVFAPITTTMSPDVPQKIATHMNHLFLAFDYSIQHSGTGDQYNWTPLAGAAEINAGDTVTNFVSQIGDAQSDALTVFTRNKTLMLYGSSSADWRLVTYASDNGGFARTAQKYMGVTFVLDDRGVTAMQASQNYGNFDAASVSKKMRPWLIDNRGAVVTSGINRDKNQMRYFFSGGIGLYMTQDGGFMPMLFGHDFTCYWSGEASDGSEVSYAGATNGYVYQFDKGTSFDGDAIDSYVELVFHHIKSPRMRKFYRRAVLEVGGQGYSEYWLSADLGYASTEIEQVPATMSLALLSDSRWDLGVWDVGNWDGRSLGPVEHELAGTAENIGIKIAQTSDYMAQLTLYSVMLHYTPRRNMR